jgi:CDP-glucose 4,6-dehydratase
MNGDFWHGKRVFVTGHTGFKGSWLALWLQRLGAELQGYALPAPTTPSLFALAGIEKERYTTFADIRDGAALRHAIVDFSPDVVLHLAAQSVVLRSYEDPLETYTTNVIGTANLLEALRALRKRCAVVNVTTDKVYENQRWVWGYRESDPLGGRDPYSNSKACAELVARAFRTSFFSAEDKADRKIGVANARAGNVIGGGDWTPYQLIPDSIGAFAEGRPVVLRHPSAIRPWQHVLDCLDGYLTLAEALYEDPAGFADDWNFGPPDTDMQPVSRVVEILARPWGIDPAWVLDGRAHPHEEMELRLNSQKAMRALGWSTRLPIDAALTWTAEWFRGHARAVDARTLCHEQIDRYMSLNPTRAR